MRPSALTQFRTLASEAILDAVRRRIIAVIAVVSLLSLMLVDTCTTCSGGEVVVNGQIRQIAAIAGWTGAVTLQSSVSGASSSPVSWHRNTWPKPSPMALRRSLWHVRWDAAPSPSRAWQDPW